MHSDNYFRSTEVHFHFRLVINVKQYQEHDQCNRRPGKHGFQRWNFTDDPSQSIVITTSGLGEANFHFRVLTIDRLYRLYVHWTWWPRKYGFRRWNFMNISSDVKVITISGFPAAIFDFLTCHYDFTYSFWCIWVRPIEIYTWTGQIYGFESVLQRNIYISVYRFR